MRIAAVVLAAGGSARMGRPKQLIYHDGEPLIARAARSAIDAGAEPVIVVLGANAAEIQPVIPRLAGIRTIVNPEWETGLASSLAAGLRAAVGDEACDGVLVTLADQPLVTGEMLRTLIRAFHAGARIVASGYEGVPGVPALFGREHVSELMELTGDTGAGPWLRSRSPEVTIVPLEGAALDLDTPADAARLAQPSGPR